MSSASSRAASRSSLATSEAARVGLVLAARAAADCYAHFVVHVRAISDDDYARVVIAEAFAHAPKLDPSGTSWLPAPFWLNGAAMMLFGRSLEVARAMALVLGFASSLLLYAGAKLIIRDARRAAIAAAVATLTPWSVYLGVATVSELPVAALSFYALATLMPGERGIEPVRWLGMLAVGMATLSRYEAWPIALGFAALTFADGTRASGRGRGMLVAAALTSLAGPAAWMAWNQHAHGDAVHFVARVAAFARASEARGGQENGVIVAGLVREHAGFTIALVVVFSWAAARYVAVRDDLRRWARPAAIVVGGLAALAAAAGFGDAKPTHHPERVALLPALAAAIAAVGFVLRLGERMPRDKHGAAALALTAVAATSFLGPTPRIQRGDEEATGLAARELARPGETVLIEVADYGYFASIAAIGRPEDAITDTIDPRNGEGVSHFLDQSALRAELQRTRARLVIARINSLGPKVLGPALFVHGAWAVWQVRA